LVNFLQAIRSSVSYNKEVAAMKKKGSAPANKSI
jgi:hypothetical protein